MILPEVLSYPSTTSYVAQTFTETDANNDMDVKLEIEIENTCHNYVISYVDSIHTYLNKIRSV